MTLARFHDAQSRIWPVPLEEVRAGLKQTHWMWFIFPQLRGLGRSPTAQHFGIAGLAEAKAYLADPTLRERLDLMADAMLLQSKPAEDVLGTIDAMKLRSSATLFMRAGGGDRYQALIERFFEGPDEATLRMLHKHSTSEG